MMSDASRKTRTGPNMRAESEHAPGGAVRFDGVVHCLHPASGSERAVPEKRVLFSRSQGDASSSSSALHAQCATLRRPDLVSRPAQCALGPGVWFRLVGLVLLFLCQFPQSSMVPAQFPIVLSRIRPALRFSGPRTGPISIRSKNFFRLCYRTLA